jgi:hypothetical protein
LISAAFIFRFLVSRIALRGSPRAGHHRDVAS